MKGFKFSIYRLVLLMALLSSCSPASQAAPTTDPGPLQTLQAEQVATSAVQTVVARITQESQPTPTELIPTQPAEAPSLTPALPSITNTPRAVGGETPCYAGEFIADVTIPDGKIMAPGTSFTKTWRIKNTGTCPWTASDYKLFLDRGDAMAPGTTFPLPRTVMPNDTVDISIPLTAPTKDGVYTGFWRIATPYGGSFGVGIYDNSLSVQITVAQKPQLSYAVIGVTYTITRTPKKGCPASGTVYTITATITTNDAGEVRYHFNQYPDDQSRAEPRRMKFTDAGSQTDTMTWTLKPEAIQNIDRWVAVYVDSPNNEEFERVSFYWTCD